MEARGRSNGNCRVAYAVGDVGFVAGKKGRRFPGESDRNLRVYYSDLKQVIETILSSSLLVGEDRRRTARQARGKKDSF
jgi:hypothetical protein